MNRLVVLAVALISLGASQPDQPLLTDPDSYAIYATILPHEWPARIVKAKRLVIAEETVTLTRCKPAIAALPDEWKPVLQDYDRQNANVWRLTSAFPEAMIPFSIVPRGEIRKLFTGRETGPRGEWTEFYSVYPDSGGFHELSAVGFDSTKTRAIVYVSHSCGNVCAEGKYHFLEKDADGWRLVKLPGVNPCFWVS